MIRLLAQMLLLLLLVLSGPLQAADSNDSNEVQGVSQDITINRSIYQMQWNRVPFDTQYFTLTNEQLRDFWAKYVTPVFRLPYFTQDMLRYGIKNYPDEFKGVDPYLLTHVDVYQRRLMDTMRDFLAGNFQEAYRGGIKLGAIGWEVAGLSEFIYAYYLADRQSVKYMMLQDVIHQFDKYRKDIKRMLTDKNLAVRANAKLLELGYAYAMGRLAEEQPVAAILARGYLPKIREAVDSVLAVDPNNPLAMALDAGISSDIIRRVGKFTGRITYSARTDNIVENFERANKEAPGQALVLYEFANSLIYTDYKRYINRAMILFAEAVRTRPRFAMQALDSMYAYKRLQEVRIYALDYRSFRRFDSDRRHFTDVTDRNLTNVLAPTLTLDMLKHPEKYKLPPLK